MSNYVLPIIKNTTQVCRLGIVLAPSSSGAKDFVAFVLDSGGHLINSFY